MDLPGRGERPSRKQFGPDAKPFRNRNQKTFKTDGGKKVFKEKLGGQLYSMDDEEAAADAAKDTEIDDFATSVDDAEQDKPANDNDSE